MTLAYNERETLETLYPLWSKVTKVKKRIRKCKINIKKNEAIKKGQSKERGSKRHRKKQTTQNTKKMGNTDPLKFGVEAICLQRVSNYCIL